MFNYNLICTSERTNEKNSVKNISKIYDTESCYTHLISE